ncbi:MAG: hypothetical protein ACOC46_03690 [Pirellulales bacterium]
MFQRPNIRRTQGAVPVGPASLRHALTSNIQHPTSNIPMAGSTRTTLTLIAALVALALGAAGIAVFTAAPYGEKGSGLDRRFDYDLPAGPIDPALIGYEQVATLRLAMRKPRAIAAGLRRIYVAGDRAVHILDRHGTVQKEIPLDAEPTAVTVTPSPSAPVARSIACLYVALGNRIVVFTPDGQQRATWPPAGDRAIFTSIAAGEDNVYVADAGHKVVRRYDGEGKRLGEIGRYDREAGIRGFVIPSPYFDVALGADGLLRAVNPGGHRIEVYTPDGRLERPLIWGRAGSAVDRFCGCCNPVAIGLMPEGRIVTAEKGIPRVKVYSASGELESVVAGPALLSPRPSRMEETRQPHQLPALDVAVDAVGRILVLDPAARMIRVFHPQPGNPLSENASGKPGR